MLPHHRNGINAGHALFTTQFVPFTGIILSET
jgi:hypothetical protein